MNIKWIIGGLVFFTVVGLSFYAGKKSAKVIVQTTRDTVIVTKTDTITRTLTKFIKGKKDTVFIDQTYKDVYVEVIDSVIAFNSDSLDFTAKIVFDDSNKTFENKFDFNLRLKEKISEVFREVPIYYEPEIWQNPIVIILSIITSFFIGVAL